MTHRATHSEHTRQPIRSLHGLAPEPLSQAARSGRAAMRADLDVAVRARGHRRVALRATGTAALLAAAVVLAVVVSAPAPSPARPDGQPIAARPAPGRPNAAVVVAPPAVRTPLVGYVADDPSVLERFGAASAPSRAVSIDDRTLLAELRNAGLEAGLIKTEGHARLAFHREPSSDPHPLQ